MSLIIYIIIYIAGIVALFGIFICAAIALAMWLCGVWDKVRQRCIDEGIEQERFRLRNAGFWFGEDAATLKLIHDLADNRDLWETRNDWRGKRNMPSAQEGQT